MPRNQDDARDLLNPVKEMREEGTALSPEEEVLFQRWYQRIATQTGLNPDPDDPLHFYNYREAFKAGEGPDETGHWPSKFKHPHHPNRFVDGVDTITGKPLTESPDQDDARDLLKEVEGKPQPESPITESPDPEEIEGPRNLIKEPEGHLRPVPQFSDKYGNKHRAEHVQREGWIKPTLKEIAIGIAGGVAGTPETIYSLANSVALWPIQKTWGLARILTGGTVEEALEIEDKLAEVFGYTPRLKATEAAMAYIGKGIDIALTPAHMAGDTTTYDLKKPRLGYIVQLAAELVSFKMAGVGRAGVKANIKQRRVAHEVLNKKLNKLTKEERRMVDEIAKQEIKASSKADVEAETKQTPFEKAYEQKKDAWLGERDVATHKADVEARLFKKDIKAGVPKGKERVSQARQIDEAIQVYIDIERNPEHIAKFYDKLTVEQKKIVDLSQNLPPYAKIIAEKIKRSYDAIGIEALGADVIRNTIDNYASRKWQVAEGKGKGLKGSAGFQSLKFKTGHAEPRAFETIVEGWAQGNELKIKQATENLRTYKHEISKIVWDKNFVRELRKLKNIDGNPLLSTRQLEGYVRVEHPNMTVWERAGKVTEGETYGKNFFATKDGQLFERRTLYAPEGQAKNINNMLGTSKIMDVPGIKAISKFNAVTKAWILQSSLFHYAAFLRSFYLPGMRLEKIGPRKAYRQGMEAIERSDPIITDGVRNGLTLGLKQDWSEALLHEKTRIGIVLDKTAATKAVKNAVTRFREKQVDFLFGEFGAGIKAKTYMIEYARQVRKHPDTPTDVIAKRVASLINDDFGGLHLQRLGRNPTLQHIFQLTALAPDWTESNIRTMVKTLKNKTADAAEIAMYRDFWLGVVVKSLAATALANYVMAGGDVEKMIENYRTAWHAGDFKWMKVNVTPIYKFFGGKKNVEKYFNLSGHFLDVIKFIVHPIRSAKHKSSVVAGVALEGLTGVDWAGRNFTDLEDLIGEGKTVKWGSKKGPVDYTQLPSYILSQLMGTQPIQVQNFIGWVAGETEGFDALLRSLGLGVSSTYVRNGQELKTLGGLKK